MICKFLISSLILLIGSVGLADSEYAAGNADNPFVLMPKDIQFTICSYFVPEDFANLSLICKVFKGSSSKNHDNANLIRANSKFNVTLEGGGMMLLKEFEESEGSAISNIKNIQQLIKDRPSDFLKLILKSVPKTPEEINDNLESYYRNVIQIADVIDSIPAGGKTPRAKLAGVITEMIIWDNVEVMVWFPIWNEVRSQIWGQNWNEDENRFENLAAEHSYYQTKDQIWDQVNEQIGGPIRDEVGAAWNRVGDLWDHVWEHADQVKDQINQEGFGRNYEQIRRRIDENMHHYQFAGALAVGRLDEIARSAINLSFLIFQLDYIIIRHSLFMKQIQNELINTIDLTDSQINAVLEHVRTTLPQEHVNPLVNSQLKMIHRYLRHLHT